MITIQITGGNKKVETGIRPGKSTPTRRFVKQGNLAQSKIAQSETPVIVTQNSPTVLTPTATAVKKTPSRVAKKAPKGLFKFLSKSKKATLAKKFAKFKKVV